MGQLSALLSRHAFRARVFYNGEFCGSNGFIEEEQAGHLHIIRHGSVTIHHLDRPTLHIDQPAIVLYPRGLNHRLCVSSHGAARLLCARIKFEDGKHSPLAKALPDCMEIPLSKALQFSSLLELLFDEADEDYFGHQMVLDRLCDVVVVRLIRYAYENGHLAQGTLAGLSDPGLTKALVMVHNDPAHAWSLNELAEVCGMSRSKFAKHFHDVVCTTPAEYVTERRMILAQSLLKKNRPVKAVATEVGYASQPAFTKAFTAKFGVSPTEWLKLNHSIA